MKGKNKQKKLYLAETRVFVEVQCWLFCNDITEIEKVIGSKNEKKKKYFCWCSKKWPVNVCRKALFPERVTVRRKELAENEGEKKNRVVYK